MLAPRQESRRLATHAAERNVRCSRGGPIGITSLVCKRRADSSAREHEKATRRRVMNSKTGMRIIALALFAALGITIQLAAQNKAKEDHPHQPHHYQLVDMGTFGGPQSYLVNTGIPRPGTDINNGGVLTGFADTATPDPFPASCFNPDCFVSYTFQWQNGGITNLGALLSGWSSVPVGISASGLIAGFSQNGEIDPLTGLPELHATLWQNGGITDLGTLPEVRYEHFYGMERTGCRIWVLWAVPTPWLPISTSPDRLWGGPTPAQRRAEHVPPSLSAPSFGKKRRG